MATESAQRSNRTIILLLIPVSLLAAVILIGGGVWMVQSHAAEQSRATARHRAAELALRRDRLESIAESLGTYATFHADQMPPAIDDVGGVKYSYFGAHKNRMKLPGGFIAACEQGPGSDGSEMFLTAFGAVLLAPSDIAPQADKELRDGENPPPSLEKATVMDR